jgi:hypothetical protein
VDYSPCDYSTSKLSSDQQLVFDLCSPSPTLSFWGNSTHGMDLALCRRCRSIRFTAVKDSNLVTLSQALGSTDMRSGLDIGQKLYFHSKTLGQVEQSAISGASEDGCVFCCLIEYELKHISYPFGGHDGQGNWRPDDEIASPIVILALENHLNGAIYLLRVFCGDRMFDVAPLRIPGKS